METITTQCDFGISPRCYGTFRITTTNFYANRKRNNGKIKCKSCASIDGKARTSIPKNDLFFRNIDCELKAYMLGVIAGDGNIKDNTLRVTANKTDIETLLLFQANISPHSRICDHAGSNCSYISFTSYELVKDICRILAVGSGKKSNIISVPEFDENLRWHYIRGLMDTDGSISNMKTCKCSYPVCSYASMSSHIKDQIASLCDDSGISYSRDKVSLRFNGRSCMLFLNRIYNDATVMLSRKYNLYMLTKLWIPGKGNPFKKKEANGN
jgi:hypothetical protein